MRRVIVTAGSTSVYIDQVRVLTNIFSGKTGHEIANYFANNGEKVTLITSMNALQGPSMHNAMEVICFKTYYDLMELMLEEIPLLNDQDILVHSAAVSDYRVDQVMQMNQGQLVPVDSLRKVSSSHQELFLRLEPTEKI